MTAHAAARGVGWGRKAEQVENCLAAGQRIRQMSLVEEKREGVEDVGERAVEGKRGHSDL